MNEGHAGGATPLVSIICPVRNESAHIENLTAALLSQNYPADRMEILIVDGMSDDGTRDLALATYRSRQAKHPVPSFTIYDNPARVTPAAMNIGLHNAKGDVLIRMDGHAEPAVNYVRMCVDVLERTGNDCVGGAIETVGTGPTGHAIAAAQSSRFGVGAASFRLGSGQGREVDTLAFGAYKREVFDRIGGFDDELVRNQDDEFNYRLIQSGGRIWLDPEIKSRYFTRSSYRALWRQYFSYGRYKVRVIAKRGGFPAARQVVPPLFVIGMTGALVISVISGRPLIAVLPAMTYGTAASTAAIVAARGTEANALGVIAAYLTMHTSYGFGFLCGVLDLTARTRV